MENQTVKAIKTEAKSLVATNANRTHNYFNSVVRWAFLSLSLFILASTVESISANKLEMTVLQIVGFLTMSVVAQMNGNIAVSLWTNLSGAEYRKYKIGLSPSFILNGVIRYCYAIIIASTAIIPIVIAVMIEGAGLLQDRTSMVVLTIIVVIWATIGVWIVNLFYSYTNYETFLYHYGVGESRKASRQFVVKHFKQYVKLNLSFIGWNLLSLFTFGFAGIYSNQYRVAANIIFKRKVDV